MSFRSSDVLANILDNLRAVGIEPHCDSHESWDGGCRRCNGVLSRVVERFVRTSPSSTVALARAAACKLDHFGGGHQGAWAWAEGLPHWVKEDPKTVTIIAALRDGARHVNELVRVLQGRVSRQTVCNRLPRLEAAGIVESEVRQAGGAPGWGGVVKVYRLRAVAPARGKGVVKSSPGPRRVPRG